jgi:hypothetical protein
MIGKTEGKGIISFFMSSLIFGINNWLDNEMAGLFVIAQFVST